MAIQIQNSDTQQHTKVEIRPSTEFMYDMAKSKLLSLILSPGFRRHAAHSLSHDQGEVEDGGDIDPLVSAADCRRRQGLIDLSNMIDLDNVDSIFEDESHPNIHSSVRGRKEGLSLFGILNSTRTPQGRHLLRQWFLRPSLDLSVIQGRQQSIECLSKPENQAIMDQMMRCLSRIKNIPRLLQAIHRKALLKDWQGIIQVSNPSAACKVPENSLKIYSMCHEFFDVETPIIHKVQELNEVGSLINDVVDFDESVIEGRCIVKPNVDEELDRMRQTYQGLDSFLSEVAKDISKTIPSHFASTFNVVYFPQLGYLITVPMNPNWKNENDFYLEGLSYQERVIEYSRLLILCSDLCAELDALLSLAQAAKLQRYTRPIMSDQTIIHIVNGRHPLQELCVESFVPNDIMIGEFHCSTASDATESTTFSHRAMVAGLPPFCPRCPNAPATIDNNHVMILCGPNCSGKSVYLKQVALITYMAHIGSFVPADHALIGLTDKILTRLQTRETVSKVHSTFMADLSQVSHAIRMATQRSLVVLDEFGKGTATTDGAGLFCGVMEHFAGLPKSQRPRVLATTHFHELFENQLMRVGSIDSLMSGMDKYDSTILQETATSERASATETAELEKSFWSAHAAVGSLQATAPPLSAHPDSASSSEPPLPISIYTMEALFDDTMFTGNSSNDLGNDVLQREPTFLFKVRPGRYPLSLGTACAATSGLPSLVVQRSIYLSQLFRRYEMVVPALGERDETRFEMYEQLIQRLLQLKFDELERPAGEDQDMTEDKLVEREKRTQEFEDNKVKPKLWADIVALLEYAEQVESFEKDEA
ncbi:MutS protein msh5 [Actinomortierella ambigua]|nr:MutS protein msh5 [Actinomortierella ambigua]